MARASNPPINPCGRLHVCCTHAGFFSHQNPVRANTSRLLTWHRHGRSAGHREGQDRSVRQTPEGHQDDQRRDPGLVIQTRCSPRPHVFAPHTTLGFPGHLSSYGALTDTPLASVPEGQSRRQPHLLSRCSPCENPFFHCTAPFDPSKLCDVGHGFCICAAFFVFSATCW